MAGHQGHLKCFVRNTYSLAPNPDLVIQNVGLGKLGNLRLQELIVMISLT